MDIDFTQNIIQMKERDVLHKPFPSQEGYSLFEKTEEGKIVRMTFSSEESVKAYLNHLGYDWGNEGKNEFRNFDCIKRLTTVLPELKDAEVVAADPQWDADAKPDFHLGQPIQPKEHDLHKSTRSIEDLPHLAVELREVDHPLHWDESNYDTKASECETCKEKVKGDYSELYHKVQGGYDGDIKVGDNVKNINPKCTHFESEGVVKKLNDIPGDKGTTVAYQCTNAGKNWKKGDILDKTPDQLTKGNCSSGVCIY